MDDSNNKGYIAERVHPIFQRIVSDLLVSKPDDLVEYMIGWLRENRNDFNPAPKQGLTKSAFVVSNILMHRLLANIPKIIFFDAFAYMAKSNKPKAQSDEEDSQSSEEEEQGQLEGESNEIIAPLHLNQNQSKRRVAISSEPLGKNSSAALKPKAKDPKAREKRWNIWKAIQQQQLRIYFLFECLSKDQQENLAFSMQPILVKKGERLLNAGDDVEGMYILENGELQVIQSNGDVTKTLTSFAAPVSTSSIANNTNSTNELKKASTNIINLLFESGVLHSQVARNHVVATQDSQVFILHRHTLAAILKETYSARSNTILTTFLTNVEPLFALNNQERIRLIDAIEFRSIPKGTIILKQGDACENVFMVEEGEILASKEQATGDTDIVASFKQGNTFPEGALLKNQNSPFTFQANANCRVLVLNRASFQRLFGSSDSLLLKASQNMKQGKRTYSKHNTTFSIGK